MEDLGSLPPQIEHHLNEIYKTSRLPENEKALKAFKLAWLEKRDLFESQIRALKMEDVASLASGEERGFLTLTYSGSLISFGPRIGTERWFEYASIKLRGDVPPIVTANSVDLRKDPQVDHSLVFKAGPIKNTSAVFKIAVCPPGLSASEQEKRVREATIFLTNGFVKVNRSLSLEKTGDYDQFNLSSMCGYIAEKNGITKKLAKRILDDFLNVVESGVLLQEKVSLGSVGRLYLRERAAQKARIVKSPSTGEEVTVPAKPKMLVPKMVFSSALKEKAAQISLKRS
jgi:nucleoid DNA-binding protein